MTQPGNGSGWLLKKLRKGQVWCALLSLSLGISVAAGVESSWGATQPQLPRFEDRAIDPSLADGVAVEADSPPSGLFYFTLGGSFLVFFALLSLFNGWVVRGLLGEAMEKERSGVLLLSQFSLALYALHLVVGDAVPESLRTALHLFCGLLILAMAAKYLVAVNMRSDKRWALTWSLLNDDQLMLAALFMPAAVAGGAGLIRGLLNPLAGMSTLVAFTFYSLVLFALLGAYALIAKRVATRSNGGVGLALYDLNTAVIVAGAPLILIPLGVLAANELQFVLPAASPQVLALAVVAILIAASVAAFVLRRRGVWRIGGVAMLAGFYFPATVVTLASYKTHQWTLNLGSLDYYGTGRMVLPAQQWSEFGSMPMLDLIPSGGLADVGVQSVFAWFNGVVGLDMLVWLPWIPVAVGFLVIYTFLALVTSPLLALLVTILLPIKAMVVGQYAMVLLPVAVLVTTLRHPDFRRFLTLWMTTALLLVWRPQLGWPTALALLVIVAWVALIEMREIRIPAAASLALVLGLVPASLLVAEVVWSGDSYAAFAGFLDLMSGSANRGFGAIETGAATVGITSFLQQALPILVVVCILYFCLRRFVRMEAPAASGYAILFLVVFSAMVPARSSVKEGALLFDPSLLLLTLGLVPFLISQRSFQPRQIGRSTWLLTTLVFCAFLGAIDIYHLVGAEAAELRTWKAGEKRVSFDSRPHETLVALLAAELSAEQTFLDFTGSPALFALANKKFPLPTITDFRSTSESRQKSQIASLDARRKAGELPLVVFRSPPRLQQAPAVPPAAAISYRISEYLYKNYLPYARVSGWEVWRERGNKRDRPQPPAKALSSRSIQQDFDLGELPYHWAARDPWESVERTEVLATVVERPVVVREEAPLTLAWPSEASLPGATYLHIRARPLSGAGTAMTVSYGAEPQSSFRFQLVRGSLQVFGTAESLNLEFKDKPKKHNFDRDDRFPDKRVFRTSGRDPWIHKFVDLSQAPPLERGDEQWISIRYRSTISGPGQVFFTQIGQNFRERNSLKVVLRAAKPEAPPRELRVPVVGVEIGGQLGNLRFDPPIGSEVEIVSVGLLRRPQQIDDYLIRLTSQFQWSLGDPQSVRFSSESQVLLDSVYLRTGD